MNNNLFDKYSRNLNEFLSLIPNLKRSDKQLYMCPLCRLVFPESSLNQNCDNPLTIEHFPPKSVGGKEIVLTCKKCNNDHGSKFDSQLVEMLNIKKIAQLKPGSQKRNVKFKIGDESNSNGNLFIDDEGKINFVMEEKRTNPKYHKEIKDSITGIHGDIKLEFSLQTYNENKIKISILRAAYLKAFKELGYAFLFNSNSEIPRKMIMNYSPTENPVKGVYTATDKTTLLGLSIVQKPTNLQSYLIGLKIELDEVEEYYNVFLPGGNTKSRQMYNVLETIKSKKPENKIEIALLDGNDFLTGSNKFFALEYWGTEYIIHKRI